MYRPRLVDRRTHMRFAGCTSDDGEWRATPPVPAAPWGPPRPILVSAAWRALKKAWWGAGCMESMLCMCMRPVVGENVYLEFLRGRASSELSFRFGQQRERGHAHFPSAVGLADAVRAVNAEADEEALFANAACLARWVRELGRVGSGLGTQAGRGARAVDADAQQLDADVGVERVEGVADECRGREI